MFTEAQTARKCATVRSVNAFALLVISIALLCMVCNTSAFDTDKLYKYQFEGSISNRVADDDKPQYAGVALSSPVLVKKSAVDELTLKLEKPQIATFNQVIEQIHLYNYSFKPLDASTSGGLDKPFRIYFDPDTSSVKSFDSHKDEPKWVTNFKRGLLSFFQLKLKQPDEMASTSTSSSSSTQNSQTSISQQQQQHDSNHQYYTSSEKSVFGECETDYLVLAEPTTSSGQQQQQQLVINVTKTRNMARCKSRFLYKFMPIDASECVENEKELQQFKHSNAIFHYDLLGTKQNYVIQQVLLDEVSTFSPFGRRAHSHLIHSKFMLKLQSIEQSTSDNAMQLDESSLTKLESLSYDPPEMVNFYANVNLDQEHHLSSIYQASASVDQVMVAFEALVQEHKAYAIASEQAQVATTTTSTRTQESSRLAELFIRLNELVGTLNSAKIEQLYAQVDERGEAYKKIFWDLMSVTGTNPSFSFMKRLIADGDAPSVRIKDFLTRLSYHIKMPSKSLFDEYVNMCKSDKIQTNQQYKRLCSLPLASLIHQHCAKPHAKYLRMQQEGSQASAAYKRGQNTCQIATAEEYFSKLVPAWTPATPSSNGNGGNGNTAGSGGGVGGANGVGGDAGGSSSTSARASSSSSSTSASSSSNGGGGNLPQSSDSSSDSLSVGDKMFNIKMAGELGVKPSVDFLMEIVANRDEHPALRSGAMWNLRKAARIYPYAVKRLVVPHYYDRNELLEVRLAAFQNWLAAGMSLHEMETMAKQLQREPSRQVVLYVHSLIKSLAKVSNPFPCDSSTGRYARLVLNTIERAASRHSPVSGLGDSYASFTSTWNGDFNYGTTSMMSIIFSNESMAPTNLHYSSSEIMSGLRLTPMSVNIQAHGLDKLIKRVIGISGMLADKESLFDLFSLKRRSRRWVASSSSSSSAAANSEQIKAEALEIEKELKLATRDFSDVYVSATISAYGRPITFLDRDSRELKKMLSEDGTFRVPQIKKLLHSFNNYTKNNMMVTFEKLEVFNNELGLPLYQSISDFDYKSFKLNSVKLDVEPGFFRDERYGKPPSKLSAAFDFKIGRHNEMFVSTGSIVSSERKQVGVGFHKKKLVNIPIKMAIEANLTANEIQVKRQPIHDSLLYVKQTPVTFVRSYDPAEPTIQTTMDSSSASSSWKPLYAFNTSEGQMKPFKLDYMTPLAIGISVQGKHRSDQDWSMAAWRRYLSQVGLQAAKFMYFYSPTGAPLEMRASTVSTEENPTRELVSHISWRHHHHEHQDYHQTTSQDDLNDIERELELSTGGQNRSSVAMGPPSTVNYKLALVGGSVRERRVSLDIAYSRSSDRLLHKWRVFYTRTPLDQNAPNSEVTNLCWLGEMMFPRQDADKLLNFDLFNLNHTANLTSDLTFGDECKASAKPQGAPHVSARLSADWSHEQRADIEAAFGNATSGTQQVVAPKKNSYAIMYKRCLERREKHGSKLDPICVQLMRSISQLTRITAQFEYKDVPERWTKLVRQLGSLYTYARAGYIEEIDDKASQKQQRNYKSTDGTNDDVAHLEANITTSPAATGGHHERLLSYEFDTPNYHVMYRNIPISVPPLSTFSLLGAASFYEQVQSRTGRATCLVSGTSVTTFDNLTYSMPPVGDGCFKLIAKDCSPESNFIVLGAGIGQSKVVKVYVGQKFKIEFVPDKDGKRIIDIKVNDQTYEIKKDESPFRQMAKLMNGSRTVEAFTIDFNGAYYTLASKLYKFSVSTDGTWILVQQSKYYAGKSCGICGDSNGDQLLEFKSPVSAKRTCKDANDFVWAHVLPSSCAIRPTNIECAN